MSTPDRIISMVRERAEAGVQKYGVTVDRTDLTLAEWVRHAQEEQLDAAQYLQRVLETFAVEIEKAWREGYSKANALTPRLPKSDEEELEAELWQTSRAKRIAEGGR